jgi:maltooligosyltrehalose synthase
MIESFHRFKRFQTVLLAADHECASTHDTKRSEDVNVRISVLSEKLSMGTSFFPVEE